MKINPYGMDQTDIKGLKAEKFSAMGKKNQTDDLEKACRDFEGLLLNQMLKEMRNTIPEGGIFEKTDQMDIWQSMYDEEVTSDIVKTKSPTGLADFFKSGISEKSPQRNLVA